MSDLQESYLSTVDSQLSNSEMMSVYQSLSVKETDEFDTLEELQYVQNSIEELFDKEFKIIDKEILQKNAILLNNKFVELIKFCKQKNNYKKVGYLFIGFCIYFDIDEVIVFKNFHEKIQNLIKISARKICGKNIYNNTEMKNRKYKDIQVISLFSLAKNK